MLSKHLAHAWNDVLPEVQRLAKRAEALREEAAQCSATANHIMGVHNGLASVVASLLAKEGEKG